MQSEPNLTPVTPITYDGTRGALTALFYKNLALSIVTFGVYRFWARHLSILGAIDPAQIERAAQPPLGSEGLTGFLGDMDAGFGG